MGIANGVKERPALHDLPRPSDKDSMAVYAPPGESRGSVAQTGLSPHIPVSPAGLAARAASGSPWGATLKMGNNSAPSSARPSLMGRQSSLVEDGEEDH